MVTPRATTKKTNKLYIVNKITRELQLYSRKLLRQTTKEGSSGGIEEQKGHLKYRTEIAKWLTQIILYPSH